MGAPVSLHLEIVKLSITYCAQVQIDGFLSNYVQQCEWRHFNGFTSI